LNAMTTSWLVALHPTGARSDLRTGSSGLANRQGLHRAPDVTIEL
jgi:hypothetical protein